MPFRVEPRAFTTPTEQAACALLRPVIPNNACTLRLTAAAGTELAGASSAGTVIIVPGKGLLQPEGLHHPRGVAGSGFAHCPRFPTAASRRSGPCLSPSVADHPLRPATDRSLGAITPPTS